MAAIEQLVVHSKDYILRWIQVPDHQSLSWSVQPNKKSINIGVFKHPGTKRAASLQEKDLPDAPADAKRDRNGSVNDASVACEKLQSKGLKCVAWIGRCEPDKVTTGHYNVPEGEGGMYGLVLDNTFSKQTSKTVQFMLTAHPLNVVPKTSSSLQSVPDRSVPPTRDTNDSASPVDQIDTSSGFCTGVLQKKRRKRGQGYANRFFSLDFTTCTLSYYRDRHSSALRGAVPLSLAAIGVDEDRREFVIDSGAEVWHLRAPNRKDFDGWREALERASNIEFHNVRSDHLPRAPVDNTEWQRLEQLVSKVSGIRDALRELARDTDPKYLPTADSSLAAEPSENPFFADEQRPFWRRRTIGPPPKRSTSGQTGSSTPVSLHPVKTSASDEVHQRCMALLHDLDGVTAGLATLVSDGKARRQTSSKASRRISLESVDAEFFDAPDTQLYHLSGDDGAEPDVASDASSDGGEDEPVVQNAQYPAKPASLSPLPLSPVKRRTTVSPPKQPPPSIIGFLRKNAGKDLSTVSMPVTANEPTSFLQRLAESLEYSALLDQAASSETAGERLMFVTAFAMSYFANSRVKERAVRKPFNPMLGETYELVREDLGFRFVAEKVSHHPVRMACQAESLRNGGWTFTQSPRPDQKFWGKSVELQTDGRCRVVLHGRGEHYSWNQATCFLRNVIAGEKYVEPVQTMTVQSEGNQLSARATFKSGGMFSGRSEEVSVALLDSGEEMSLALTGKWTENLKRTDTGAVVWTVGALVPDAARVYGFTTFAASLNEVTEIEAGKLPPTDSRLRPDQKALEEGRADDAEELKARLEEQQRVRRRELQGEYQPLFFDRVSDDDGLWMLKPGENSYWRRRETGDWKGVVPVFELQ
ncbi:hypothetical protein K470DRAFT_223296 [Piedraia hortae CBS 480.64]|uniref:PH domain-containing protein n=1 Tax=Piedraia hortae CBS 480.64 TaxID=1314780 RepID=A0A6A7BQV1_9PEZI|nr:hypothetical protein K470DRAFT_223296 [Piedraia hortae CBS 480.64]